MTFDALTLTQVVSTNFHTLLIDEKVYLNHPYPACRNRGCYIPSRDCVDQILPTTFLQRDDAPPVLAEEGRLLRNVSRCSFEHRRLLFPDLQM